MEASHLETTNSAVAVDFRIPRFADGKSERRY